MPLGCEKRPFLPFGSCWGHRLTRPPQLPETVFGRSPFGYFYWLRVNLSGLSLAIRPCTSVSSTHAWLPLPSRLRGHCDVHSGGSITFKTKEVADNKNKHSRLYNHFRGLSGVCKASLQSLRGGMFEGCDPPAHPNKASIEYPSKHPKFSAKVKRLQ